jgi:hypothetical protein
MKKVLSPILGMMEFPYSSSYSIPCQFKKGYEEYLFQILSTRCLLYSSLKSSAYSFYTVAGLFNVAIDEKIAKKLHTN